MSKLRKYSVTPTMLEDRFTERVIQPDAILVKQFQKLLNLIPSDDLALAIDFTVRQLITFHNPNRQHYAEIMPHEAHTDTLSTGTGEI